MDPRIDKLINAFQQKGWVLKGSVDTSSDWWFSDIIQLRSTWRPVGKEIYLTLLTDPMIRDKKSMEYRYFIEHSSKQATPIY